VHAGALALIEHATKGVASAGAAARMAFGPRAPGRRPFGFFGIAPILIVGSRPSRRTEFNGEQCNVYYRLLHEHGLHDAHLTDCIKTDPKGCLTRKFRQTFCRGTSHN
jgi:hypothetical protein